MTSSVQLVLEVRQKTTGLNQGVRAVESAGAKMRASATKTQSAMNLMGSSIKKAFAGFIGITAAVSFLRSAEMATRKFSGAVAELSAITGATGKDLQFLKDSAMDLGSTTLSSASEVAEAFKLVGSVKADLLDNVEALKSVTEEVILLSTASGVDLATAAKVTGSALNQFGADASEAARFVNVLAAGSKYGAAEVNDLGESLKFVGPVAGTLGISIEETVAALELLAEAGIKGSEAGTGLRAVLIRLSTQSKDHLNPAVVGLTTALENLKKEQLDVGEATDLFGRTAVTSGLALTNFSHKMQKMTKDVTGTKTAMEQAAIMADSYAGQVKKLGNAWEGLQISIGESVGKSGIIASLTTDINNLSNSIREYGLVFGTLKGLTYDPINQTRKAIVSRITPDTGDAGASSTVKFEDVMGFKRSEIPSIAKEFQDKIGESFIVPIAKAGGKLTYFAETAQEAANRLQNSFGSNLAIADPYKSAANDIINKLGEQRKKEIKPSRENVNNSQFMKNINEGTKIANDLKFARGDERQRLLQQLENLNNKIDAEAYQNKNVGSYAVGTASGGSFSVVGNSQATETEQRIKKSLADQFNNFITQQLNQEKRITVTVNVKPDNDSLVKFVGKAVSKEINDAAKSIAN